MTKKYLVMLAVAATVIGGALGAFLVHPPDEAPPLQKTRERKVTKMADNDREEVATLGGGCFWCLEAVFEQLRGVTKVESGYAGGEMADPSYELVCTGRTGHAEVVQITYDPTQISYRDLLEVF